MTDRMTATEQVARWMIANGYATGHGDDVDDLLRHLVQEVRDQALRAALAEPEPVAWTPVGEAMPKSGVVVLACYRNRLGNLRRIRAHWIAAKTEEADEDFDYGEYDEETDRCWTPEGWYECIDNWGDYSSVAVCEGEVTHWMPLPPEPGAAPPRREWVSLTDEERKEFAAWMHPDVLDRVERLLKERNA